MLLLALNPILTNGLVIVFLFVCILLILTVLIQRPSGGGLSGAFGSGAGSGQTAFGAKTGDALTIATIIMFVLFLGFAVGLNYAARPSAPEGPAVVPVGTPETGEGSTTTAPSTVPPAQPEQSAAEPDAAPPAGGPSDPTAPPTRAPTTPPMR